MCISEGKYSIVHINKNMLTNFTWNDGAKRVSSSDSNKNQKNTLKLSQISFSAVLYGNLGVVTYGNLKELLNEY